MASAWNVKCANVGCCTFLIYSEESSHIMKEKYLLENVSLRDVYVVKVLGSVSLRITKMFYGSKPKELLSAMC